MEQKLRDVLNLLEDKHAKDIEVFEMGAKHPLYDSVVIASVDVDRNLDAIINEFKAKEKDGFLEVKNFDDKNREWVIIDLYDIIVHIFVREARQYYSLEEVLAKYVD